MENQSKTERIISQRNAENQLHQTCLERVTVAVSTIPMHEGIVGGATEYVAHFLPHGLLEDAARRMGEEISDLTEICEERARRAFTDEVVQNGLGGFVRQPSGELSLAPEWKRLAERYHK